MKKIKLNRTNVKEILLYAKEQGGENIIAFIKDNKLFYYVEYKGIERPVIEGKTVEFKPNASLSEAMELIKTIL